MSSTTPNIGLVKLSATENFSNANALAGNWDKIDAYVAAYDLGNNTLANIQTALYNLGASMNNGESRIIAFNITQVSGVFAVTGHIGDIKRISSSRFVVNLRQSMWENYSIVGNYKDGTWYWGKLAEDDAIFPSIDEFGIRMITYHTPTNPSGSVNGISFNIQSVAYTWGSFIVYTRYGIHTLNFTVDGAMNIGVRTSKIDSFNSETLTATVSNRVVTVTSSIGWNYFAIEGRSTQSGSTFSFNYVQES